MLDLRPLRSVGFRHLVVAQWINEGGTLLGEVALAILVYNQTRSAWATALLFVCLRFLPAILAPVLAIRAEAWRPRLVLPLLYLVEAAVFAIVAGTSRPFSLPLVLGLVSLDGVCAISSATLNRSAMATGLTADGLLREGNSMLNVGATTTTAAAPVVAGVLVASNGAATALLIDAATFALAAVIIATARGIRIETELEGGLAGRIKAGTAILRTRPLVRRLVVATALTFGISQIAIPVEVVYAKTTLHAGDAGYGLLLTSWGAGMVGGAALFALSDAVSLMLLLGAGTCCVAMGYGGLALSPSIAVACAASVLGGVGNGIAWVAAKTALQERIPLGNQTAVLSVLDALNQVLPALGFMAGGALASLSSPRTAYAASAIGVGLVLTVCIARPAGRIPLSQVPDPPASAPRADEEHLTGQARRTRGRDLQDSGPLDRTSVATSPLANG